MKFVFRNSGKNSGRLYNKNDESLISEISKKLSNVDDESLIQAKNLNKEAFEDYYAKLRTFKYRSDSIEELTKKLENKSELGKYLDNWCDRDGHSFRYSSKHGSDNKEKHGFEAFNAFFDDLKHEIGLALKVHATYLSDEEEIPAFVWREMLSESDHFKFNIEDSYATDIYAMVKDEVRKSTAQADGGTSTNRKIELGFLTNPVSAKGIIPYEVCRYFIDKDYRGGCLKANDKAPVFESWLIMTALVHRCKNLEEAFDMLRS